MVRWLWSCCSCLSMLISCLSLASSSISLLFLLLLETSSCCGWRSRRSQEEVAAVVPWLVPCVDEAAVKVRGMQFELSGKFVSLWSFGPFISWRNRFWKVCFCFYKLPATRLLTIIFCISFSSDSKIKLSF